MKTCDQASLKLKTMATFAANIAESGMQQVA